MFTESTPTPTPTSGPCEDYTELCLYLTENFNMECFGTCDRYHPFDPNNLDVEDAFEECNGEIELSDK